MPDLVERIIEHVERHQAQGQQVPAFPLTDQDLYELAHTFRALHRGGLMPVSVISLIQHGPNPRNRSLLDSFAYFAASEPFMGVQLQPLRLRTSVAHRPKYAYC